MRRRRPIIDLSLFRISVPNIRVARSVKSSGRRESGIGTGQKMTCPW